MYKVFLSLSVCLSLAHACTLRPCEGRVSAAACGWIFYLLRGGASCGPDQCGAGCRPPQAGIHGAVRAAAQDMAKNMRGGGGGPNDIVVGRVRAQLFQPAQFVSKFAHCLCLLVGGLPDSYVCVCVTLCVACTTACVQ